jgi:hypothetical protein
MLLYDKQPVGIDLHEMAIGFSMFFSLFFSRLSSGGGRWVARLSVQKLRRVYAP